jgi:H+-transporting ATPase
MNAENKNRESQTKTRGNVPKPGKAEPAEAKLHDMPVEEIFKRLDSSTDGLSKNDAKKRLDQYGYNELVEEKVNPVLKFLSYFKGPIPGMIIAAAILSAVLHHIPDVAVILALLFMNAIVGFREEYQAGNAVAALKKQLAVQATVKRDGAWVTIQARELVPGDIIRLRIGSIIPADAKLLEGDPVEVDQSALTGESLPVEHKSGDAVYSGSILRQGEIEALVYATGANTYFGKTAELVGSTKTRSHFQKAVIKIADYLIVIAAALAAVIIVVAIFRGDKPLTVLEFALILTIASIPVAMPAVLSVTMALGAKILAAKKAIVTRLSAVEELAGIDVLCSDKTGTLTQAKLTLGDTFALGKINPEEVILAGALASRAEDKDPIDMAVLAGVKKGQKLDSYQVVHFQPFDPVHKRTEATVKGEDGKEFKVTKGAAQVILALDSNADKIQDEVNKTVNEFATRGFRSLGVARTNGKDQWRFLGVLPLYDPLREDSKSTVDTAEQMGIKVKMVTGDQIAIAKEIGNQLNLGKNIMDATAFGDTKHHETGQMIDAIEQADGFAQVFPEHKYHIVDVLQQRGHIVGMTGDGVNDAPALKKADAGIAVAGALDAARAAADLVLTTPGLSVIVDAIKEARKTFQRMTSYSIYRIAETIALLGFITLAILIFKIYPVTAIMIVLVAMINDFSILTIAYDKVRYDNKPEAWDMRFVMSLAGVLGGFAVVRSFGMFYLGLNYFHLSTDVLRTLIYLSLSVGGILTLINARTRGAFWSIRPARPLLIATIGAMLAATFIAVYGGLMTPLGWHLAGVVWAYSLGMFLIQDRVKLMGYKIFSKQHSGLFGRHVRAEEE